MKDDLTAALEAVRQEFEHAPVWTDPAVKVRTGFARVNGKAVPTEPRASLPNDPFSVGMDVLEGTSEEGAKARYYVPAGRALALHARTYGAKRADEVDLSISTGPASENSRVLIVTATPKAKR